MAIERQLGSTRPEAPSLESNGVQVEELCRQLLGVDTGARDCLETYIERLIHTLQTVPRADGLGAEVLELGPYRHIAHTSAIAAGV